MVGKLHFIFLLTILFELLRDISVSNCLLLIIRLTYKKVHSRPRPISRWLPYYLVLKEEIKPINIVLIIVVIYSSND